ncbi:unnamed protein product, partial [Ectocarpus sp. 12 AP-2014]
AEACIVLKEDGVPVNVRLAGEDDVGKRSRDYKRAGPTMLDTDQLIAKSTQPFHVGCGVKHRRELEDKINESCPLSQNASHRPHQRQ